MPPTFPRSGWGSALLSAWQRRWRQTGNLLPRPTFLLVYLFSTTFIPTPEMPVPPSRASWESRQGRRLFPGAPAPRSKASLLQPVTTGPSALQHPTFCYSSCYSLFVLMGLCVKKQQQKSLDNNFRGVGRKNEKRLELDPPPSWGRCSLSSGARSCMGAGLHSGPRLHTLPLLGGRPSRAALR